MNAGNLRSNLTLTVHQDGLLGWLARLAAKRGVSLALIAAILIVDIAIPWTGWSYMPRWQGLSFVPRAFVDEPCAVATALIVLGAITRFRGAPPGPKFGWSLLAWSVSGRVKPGSGFFTSSSPPVLETPYYGYFLASVLAQPSGTLGRMATSDPFDVLAFQASLADGKHAVAFVSVNTQSPEKVKFRPVDGLAGTLRKWSYSAASQKSRISDIITGTGVATTITNDLRLPAESIVVLETE